MGSRPLSGGTRVAGLALRGGPLRSNSAVNTAGFFTPRRPSSGNPEPWEGALRRIIARALGDILKKAHPAPKSSTEHLACQRRRGIGTPIIPVGLGAEMRQGSALYVAKPLRCLPRGTSRHRRGLHGERYAHAHRYSHSIVAGGFVLMSYTTRFTPLTSLTMRVEILSSTSDGSLTQSHVIPSSLVTARITMGRS